ncbi:phage tail assembly chaperone [Pragia fontium]|uniref:phage tail assembly chaperone n=1 Tax=Pragia fontium TaxID=82985 RepID=UPI00064AF861|nr:phage tail assembly chaperone [Pragia fontium]AKJ41476.1 hypothetical protein QQ39_04760 [Pragia fontium]
MAVKFTLIPSPTFKADVKIPYAGGKEGELTFTFKHKPMDELAALESKEDLLNIDLMMEIIAGWALPDEFNRENMEVLLNNYPQAGIAITKEYHSQILGLRIKN